MLCGTYYKQDPLSAQYNTLVTSHGAYYTYTTSRNFQRITDPPVILKTLNWYCIALVTQLYKYTVPTAYLTNLTLQVISLYLNIFSNLNNHYNFLYILSFHTRNLWWHFSLWKWICLNLKCNNNYLFINHMIVAHATKILYVVVIETIKVIKTLTISGILIDN
jgi:hypothetical protein